MTLVVPDGAGVVEFEYEGHLLSNPEATALATRAKIAKVCFMTDEATQNPGVYGTEYEFCVQDLIK